MAVASILRHQKGTPSMEFIATPDAPQAIGPYSQAVVHHGMLYSSGQIALDPRTGALVTGDFAAQVTRVFDNLEAVLRARASDFSRVLKGTVDVTEVKNFN